MLFKSNQRDVHKYATHMHKYIRKKRIIKYIIKYTKKNVNKN